MVWLKLKVFGIETNSVLMEYPKIKPIQNIDHMFNAAKYNIIQNTKECHKYIESEHMII